MNQQQDLKFTSLLIQIRDNIAASSGGSGGTNFNSLLDPYEVSDTDQTSPNYFGLVHTSGKWVILKQTTMGALDAFLYAKGPSAYATAWTGRAGLIYVEFDLLGPV